MKKTFYILAALLLVLTVTVPICASAASANPGEIVPQANCSHSSYTSSYYYSYVYMDSHYHEVYRTERRQCNNSSCRDIFYIGNPEALPLEAHIVSKSYIKSVHLGDISGHYYLYGGTCGRCKEWVEEKRPAYCRNGMCIDPYSLKRPVETSEW
ncbi:MAG: hypothetical protein ACI3VZ_02540 [Faecousia sp.]